MLADLPLIHLDHRLLAVHKPAGLLLHPATVALLWLQATPGAQWAALGSLALRGDQPKRTA